MGLRPKIFSLNKKTQKPNGCGVWMNLGRCRKEVWALGPNRTKVEGWNRSSTGFKQNKPGWMLCSNLTATMQPRLLCEISTSRFNQNRSEEDEIRSSIIFNMDSVPSFNAGFELHRGLPHYVFITVRCGIKSNIVTPRLTSSGFLNTSREFTIDVSSDSDSVSVLTCSPRGFDLMPLWFQSPLAFKDFMNSMIRHRTSNTSIRFRRSGKNRYWINLLPPLQPLQFSFSPSLFFDASEDYCCNLFNTGWRRNESLLWNEDEAGQGWIARTKNFMIEYLWWRLKVQFEE